VRAISRRLPPLAVHAGGANETRVRAISRRLPPLAVHAGGANETRVRAILRRLPPLVVHAGGANETRVRAILRRLPPLAGAPLRVENVRGLADRRGPVHAGSFLRERRIALNCTRAEFPRIFVHELFHFVWLRAGNAVRLSWEALLESEHGAGARGELGWSAEWRKQALAAGDRVSRSRRWREYCCESFCDTAAWLYSGIRNHAEFTLAGRHRTRRRAWFRTAIGNRQLPV
jgi:hypothetical protein